MGSDAADDSACPIPFFYMKGKFSELPSPNFPFIQKALRAGFLPASYRF